MAEIIELYLQQEGTRGERLVRVSSETTIGALLAELGLQEPAGATELLVSIEDAEGPLAPACPIAAAGIGNGHRLHVHRCHRVEVTVHFNDQTKQAPFGPNTTIAHVTRWFTGKQGFDMNPTDAAEHQLQVTGADVVPQPNDHLGTLVSVPGCAVSFDLVPKHRVEG